MATILAFFLFLFFLLWILRKAHITARKSTLPPEAGGAWPLIGHLHLLRGPKPIHITLGKMADKYGSLFRIRLGAHPALVVNNWEVAKECFTTHDKVFANRPKSIASELMGYNYALFVLSPYGPYWRQMRKIATLEVLSNHRIAMLKHIRQYEVSRSIKETYELWVKNNNTLVDMQIWFLSLGLNIVFKMVVGKRFYGSETEDESVGDDQCRQTLKEVFELSGTVVVGDVLPYLRWLDFGGYEKTMKKTAKEFDHVIEGWLEEHKQRKVSGEAKGDKDFMDVMLSVVANEEKISNYDADTITKATCLVSF
jgi:hypothetical protein